MKNWLALLILTSLIFSACTLDPDDEASPIILSEQSHDPELLLGQWVTNNISYSGRRTIVSGPWYDPSSYSHRGFSGESNSYVGIAFQTNPDSIQVLGGNYKIEIKDGSGYVVESINMRFIPGQTWELNKGILSVYDKDEFRTTHVDFLILKLYPNVLWLKESKPSWTYAENRILDYEVIYKFKRPN